MFVAGSSRGLILRGFIALVAVAAIIIAVLWTWALVFALGEDFHGPALVGYERRSIVILGVLGIGALVVAGGSGFAYAWTTAKAWITPVVAGGVCAIPVFVVWIDLYEVFSGSN